MKHPTIDPPRPDGLPPRIRLPGPVASSQAKPKPKPRDELAQSVGGMAEVAAHVRRLRAGLSIRQEELARRAGVSRHWLIALEQGKGSLEAAMVLRTLEALGFALTLTPTDPPPPWMLRACADAEARRVRLAAGRRLRRARGAPGRGSWRWRWQETRRRRGWIWSEERVRWQVTGRYPHNRSYLRGRDGGYGR